ncbi:hypothetical protein B8V09_03500 [Streptococcus agalactiae]|nr:hypothetical protein B8V09_03500 [Streptococcus agalactiae]
MAKNNSSEQTARKIERLKNFYSNPENRVKRLEQLKIYNSSPEHREHLKKLQERSSFKVEIFDTIMKQLFTILLEPQQGKLGVHLRQSTML